MTETMKGTVKWFSEKKGYGFITGADGKDYFFHHSSIVMSGFKTLYEEDQVEFIPERNEKGLMAKEVIRVIDKS